jgi:hypothetical protein
MNGIVKFVEAESEGLGQYSIQTLENRMTRYLATSGTRQVHRRVIIAIAIVV